MDDVLIERFGLQPHPEGGYFRETFRGADRVVRELTRDAVPGEALGIDDDLLHALRRRTFGVAPDPLGRGVAFLCRRAARCMSSTPLGSWSRIAWVMR